MTVADPKRFTPKSKPVTYTRIFVELYNWRNGRQVHKIHGMIDLEKMRALTAEDPRNFGTHRIIKISSILCSTHMVLRNQDKFVFYVNNYIDLDQFNQLYGFDWMENGVQNTDAVAHKLRLASIRVSNHKLEVAKEERRKRQEMVERQKTEVMTAKHCRDRGGISLSIEEEGNYESDTRDDTDSDQANDKYPLQY